MFGKVKSPEFIAMQSSEAKRGANNPRYGKPVLPHFSKYIQPKPVYVYDSVSKAPSGKDIRSSLLQRGEFFFLFVLGMGMGSFVNQCNSFVKTKEHAKRWTC